MKGIIVVDPKRCLGCHSCHLHCATAHSESKQLMQAIQQRPLPQPRINVEAQALPLQCRHCEDAPCVEVCATKALERKDQESPVLINDRLCIGCKQCILVCPFGVIYMDAQGKAVTKCDLCFERLQKDELPACVSGCPTGALQFKSIEQASKEEKKEYLIKYKKS
ncbi:4Fe-4S dicluster domain-containing protein [Candidatus Omnitrophota bacterium]